ncbi:hypothetical protein [Pseudoalteromonas luteoviolacea]|uniref:Uncharacterized protein n=1 Tax=Pseudoalteromonas luteoviolacea H33 TaxID=1365251 RepID=A0A166ZTP0_9GAMM|nr:hypothetical protein [Pseudoalteromonas luteoviolacea]KZN44652.1 hypothetical protein N476_26135 [Pseudoalteromonas luteoviolacea H33]KZN71962.1 hypothetical protein N477_25480 [Pseudoalteromonas luteoviolacea H33-S]MBQ4878699.1 hypothetical protein [Pseudoalteromonas luteoviolacea]MBQ4907239.1 hypothetical protein [Pseudoalteromonas luteoviolacea]
MTRKLLSIIAGSMLGLASYAAQAATVSAWGGAEHLNYDTARGSAILNLKRRYPNVRNIRIAQCFRVTYPPAYKVGVVTCQAVGEV